MVISRKLPIMLDIRLSKARSADYLLIHVSTIIDSLRLVTYLKHFTVFESYIIAFKCNVSMTLPGTVHCMFFFVFFFIVQNVHRVEMEFLLL